MNDTSETEMENCHKGCQLNLSQSGEIEIFNLI